MRKQLVLTGATLLATTLAVSACGTRAEEATGGSGETATKTAKIGVIAPLSGDLSALGLGIQHSVELAVKQANENQAIPGWTLEVDPQDDQGLPDPGKNAATKLAGDDDVVGVVGTLNSSVAQSVQPVLNSADIAMVSPANTSPTLTKGADPANPQRAYESYFRTCTTDDVQGPFAAKYLLEQDIKSVATVHDKKAYGQGLVAAFTTAFEQGGGEVVASETINPDDKDFSSVISKVKGSNPEALYYGGEFPQGAPLSQQMKSAGLDVPLMGGDGIKSEQYFALAGSTAEGDLSTSVGAPPETLDSAKQFLADYEAEGFADPYEAYGAYAYDAANAIIEGLKTSLGSAEDAKSARAATVEAIGGVSFQGATGDVAFDEFGDATAKVLTVYKVEGDKWVADQTGS
ncbi:branched-chain amino acid ABC transporter substrate-binding protein [Microlunatus lacustris]